MENISKYLLRYIKLKVRFYQFEAIEKIGEIKAQIILKTFLILMFFNFLIFAGFALSFYLGELLGSYYKGFGIVSLVFIFSTLLIYILRKPFSRLIVGRFVANNIPS